MITVAIIMILMVVMMKGSGWLGAPGAAQSKRADGKGTTVLGAAKYAAEDTVCQSDLAQIRQSIIVYKTSNDDQAPARLEDTKLGDQFYRCPVGHEAYVYDPATGQVHCPHPGHENY
jgi:hypothetical protein